MPRHSVAMTAAHHRDLSQHLLRADGQEDICLATYTVSTGANRTTRLIASVELPRDGEREVHGNATITGAYVLRVAAQAAREGRGVVMMHSHPRGRRWQQMSAPDADAESSYAGLVEQLTGLPLVGMTLAGDGAWSARVWIDGKPEWAGSVRRVGATLHASWNDDLVPSLADAATQARTISAWGEDAAPRHHPASRPRRRRRQRRPRHRPAPRRHRHPRDRRHGLRPRSRTSTATA